MRGDYEVNSSTKAQFVLSLIVTCVFAVCFSATSSAMEYIELKDAHGKTVGYALLQNTETDVLRIHLMVHDLPPGEHVVLFHRNAKCDPPDFMSAGPKFESDGHRIASLRREGHDVVATKIFTVDTHGKADVRFEVGGLTINHDPGSQLFRTGNASLVIHTNAGDLRKDASGNSGGRIACGIFSGWIDGPSDL